MINRSEAWSLWLEVAGQSKASTKMDRGNFHHEAVILFFKHDNDSARKKTRFIHFWHNDETILMRQQQKQRLQQFR